ncbi:S1/P1 nuclease [Pseudomonas sp. CM27]|uniref:S1/P1 nuclease n=1 Tax=Pseudomonas sp. CM27 TaxID=2738452 RepID=UPI0015516AFC|nr:S1/P1 nuclease [Pseudomonas sp. CM27]NQD74514.1 S1/P1 nuclease [Pseudomonas sp. CM27]
MKILQLILIYFLATSYSQSSFAWGVEGHKVVALVAEARLSPEAKQGIDQLLQRDAGGKISDIASWADDMRGNDSVPQISHVVKIPFNARSYSAKRDCSGKYRCVIEGIYQSEAQLGMYAKSKEITPDTQQALKFLVHYVGDVHQPLHAIRETGVMRTLPSRQRWKLHKVWDTIIIRSLHQSPERIAERLLSHPKRIEQYTPEDWAMESHDIAKRVIYGGSYALARSKRPIPLSDGYYKENTEIVDERLLAAGVRLGNLLNSIFK